MIDTVDYKGINVLKLRRKRWVNQIERERNDERRNT